MKSIAVFCGSNPGKSGEFSDAAAMLGKELAIRNITIIYGGATPGLMGVLADSALANGGKIIGVIPDFLEEKEIRHEGLTQLFTVRTMHERKAKMNELCEGVIVLPGGLGTLDEVFEMLTWGQLGLHTKPIGFLNISGYFNSLLKFLDESIEQKFMKEETRLLWLVDSKINSLIDKLTNYTPISTPKWIREDQV